MADDVPISLLLEKLQKLQLLGEDKIFFAPLRNKVGKIIGDLNRILTFIEEGNASCKTLLAQLFPILYSAEYIIDSFLLETTHRRRKGVINKITRMPLLAFMPWSQMQLGCKMKEIEKRIRDVSIKFGKVDKTVDPIPQALGKKHSNFPRRSYDAMPDQLIGRGYTEKELVGRLTNDEEESLRVISLVSEESLGKTALAKKVYNRIDIRQHFQCRVWVNVPEDIVYKDLLLNIIAQIPIVTVKDVELMSENQLSEMLFQIFMELKFLIVLDNIWTIDVWLKFARPFADMANGSRVILTTRNNDVALQVDPWSVPLCFKRLTDEDSWLLFLNKVKIGRPEANIVLDIDSDDLTNFRVQILRICCGLPPAIVLLGGVLSTIGLSEWSSVIDHLSHLCGDDDHSVPLSSILAFSYHKLPFVLRPCLLYLSLFPKMYEIPVRRLLHLWLAEGFVQILTSATSGVPEDIVQSYLEELVCRNMIEISKRKPDGSPKTCRLPCFLHEVFLPKAEDVGFLHVHLCKSECKSPDSPKSNTVVRRLADQYFGGRSTSESHTQTLCSYILFESQKRNTPNREIETLLQRIMKRKSGVVLLKVFDLESVYRPVLPDKLGELQNLTYIGLRWTGLYSCPASIGDLPCLQTLDLKYTNITTLPSSIWKAKNLRHLYMNEVSITKPSKEPSTNLQTLMGLQIGSKDPDEFGLNRLTSLRKLQLTCHSKSVGKTIDCISGLGNLQTLKLRSRDPFGQPSDIFLGNKLKVHRSLLSISLFGVITDGIGNLPQNLKILSLSMSQLKEGQMQLLAKLPQLNILGLLGRSYAGSEMVFLPGDFPELRVLKLWMLENLEQWWVEEGGMPKLEELEIRGCGNLTRFDGLEHLRVLKELVLTNMPPDFVADVGKRFRRDILLANEWKASSSLA